MTALQSDDQFPDPEYDDEPDVKSDDFDTAVGSALADAAASAPRQPDGSALSAKEPIMFEGKRVARTEIKAVGTITLNEAYEGVKLGLDDRVRLVIETRVSKVNHYVDKDGDLVRSQELRIAVVDIVPWNPTDPSDDGIIRA